MALLIVVIILIVSLIGYIIFLHFKLSEKNIFIESTVKRLSGIEKSRSMEEMMSFLREIQKISQYRSFFQDKFSEENTLNFILENEKDLNIFMHYTRKENDANNILKEGFKFADSFYKTALHISKDKLDLTNKHNRRKSFGDYIIVICISNDIVNFYSLELKKAGITNYSFENILTETLPSGNDNSGLIYKLPVHFIKGYINHRTGEIIRNPDYDPLYNSPAFIKNIDLLKIK